jgi:hypothetical protein
MPSPLQLVSGLGGAIGCDCAEAAIPAIPAEWRRLAPIFALNFFKRETFHRCPSLNAMS